MNGEKRKKPRLRLWAVLFWVGVWEIASLFIQPSFLLASPLAVAHTLAGLVRTGAFWLTVLSSAAHILCGLLLAAAAGIGCAVLGARYVRAREMLAPLMLVIQSVPVVSFIVLVLLWIKAARLSMFISFLIVLPVMYKNVQEGLLHVDNALLEMAQVFRLRRRDVLAGIYLPQLMPSLRSAFSLSLGLCWKAGVAAEVIGLPVRTIGEQIYQSKIYLDSANLFAWTIVIIALSAAGQKLCGWLLDRLLHSLQRRL